MKQGVFRFTAAVFLFLLTAGGCASASGILNSRPQFRFRNAEFVGIEKGILSLTVHTELVNPWPVPLPAGTLDTAAKLESVNLTSMKIPFPEVRAGGSVPVPFQISVPLTSVIKAAESVPDNDFLLLETEGSASLKVLAAPETENTSPSGSSGNIPSVQIPFYHKEEIPAFFPLIEVQSLTMQKPVPGSPSALKATALITVRNSGKAEFLIDQPSVSLFIENKPFTLTEAPVVTPEGTQNLIRVETSVPLASAGSAVLSALTRGTASWKAEIISGIIFIKNKERLKPIRFSGTRNGTVPLTR